MKLEAHLTTGWPDDPTHPFAAQTLHDQALATDNYGSTLQSKFAATGTQEIFGLEQLFRKRTAGFRPLKQLVGALAALPAQEHPLICHIDLFAYAYLKGAKNFDLWIPLAPDRSSHAIPHYPTWLKTLTDLEALERFGRPLPLDLQPLHPLYLELRGIFTRPSTRDEQRALALLLVNGPSTLAQISQDLGLNYTLSQQTLGIFVAMGLVLQPVDSEIYRFNLSTLPLVIFCLRETLGLDLLSLLPLPQP